MGRKQHATKVQPNLKLRLQYVDNVGKICKTNYSK